MRKYLAFVVLLVLLLGVTAGPIGAFAQSQTDGGSGGGQNSGGSGGSQTDGGSGGSQTDGGSGGSGCGASGGLCNPLNNIDSLPSFLEAILKAVVEIGSVILLLALVYTGFLFVAAQGNQEKISSARSALMWTVIGGVILLGASAIGMVIRSTVDTLR